LSEPSKHNLYEFLESREEAKVFWFLFIFSAFIGLIAQYFSYSNELIFCPNFGDPVTRLDSSRRFYDSFTPGIWNQIGTVWLPAHSILLIPFTEINYLWQTGIAGSILGFSAYLISSLLIFRIIFKLTGNNIAAIVGWALFAFNPNILFLQTTAMSEPIFYAFIIITFYYLQRLTEDWERMDIVKASFFMMCAVATRYEGWVLMFFFTLIVFYIYLRKKHKPFKYSFTFSSLSLAFIFFWLWHNWNQYGDPLEFQRGKYSLLHHAMVFLNANLLPTKDNLEISIEYFSKAVWINTGWFTVIIASAGIILYAVKYKLNLKRLFPYGLLVLFPFSVYSLYAGQNVLMLPNASPHGFVHSRYGLSLLPAIAIFGGFAYYYLLDSDFIKKATSKIKNLITIAFISIFILGQLIAYIVDFPENIASLEELNYGSRQMYYKIKGASEYLAGAYDGGNILYDEVIVRLLPSSNIPYNQRIFPNTWEIGEKSLQKPSQYVKWVIIDREMHRDNKLGLHYDEVYDRLRGNRDFKNNYRMVYAKDGVEIYKKD